MSRRIRIDDLAAIWVICWTFIPFMQVGNIYRIITVVCAGVWLLIHIGSVIREQGVFVLIQFFTIFLRVFLLYIESGSALTALANSIQYIIVIVIAVMAVYYFNNDLIFIKKLVPIVFILLIIFSITTMKGTMDDPYASRIANTEWLETRYEGNEMVGLYGYVYMCVFIEPLLLYSIFYKISFGWLADKLKLVVFIIDFLMIITSGYMIAIFLTLVGCAMVWMNYKKNIVKTFLIVFAIIVFLIFYKTLVNDIFTFLMQLTQDNPVYYDKFNDLRTLFLNGSTSGETVSGRFTNYEASLKNMLNYPVLGSYFFGVPGGGGHSALIDVFGRFGWIVGGVFVYTYVVAPHKVGKTQIKWNALDYIVLIQTMMFLLIDPVFQEIALAVFIMFPLVNYLSREQLKGNEL